MDLSQKRLFLLDMDGTIYLDDDLFDGTVDFLNYVNQIGGKYLFLTNNSSRSVTAYVEKMARLGIAATPEDFLTSVDATVLHLQANFPGKLCYVSGTETFKDQLLCFFIGYLFVIIGNQRNVEIIHMKFLNTKHLFSDLHITMKQIDPVFHRF